MPTPIYKEQVSLFSENWVSGLKRRYDLQVGVNNQVSKGKVSSNYSRTVCSTLSLARWKSDGLAFGYSCNSSHGTSVMSHNVAAYGPLKNRAYSNFKENATGSQSQVGATFAEWEQTLGLVTSTALTLARQYKEFKRGWGDSTDLMYRIAINPRTRRGRLMDGGVDVPRDLVRRASQAWLTYWFGIAPLAGDLATSLFQASDVIPDGQNYQGSAQTTFYRVDSTSNPRIVNEGTYKVSTGARVRLTNPNLYLASQLGLVNPASVAWEIVPFSFLADWVFDIGSFIESFSDFVGCSVEMPYTSQKAEGIVSVSGYSYILGTWKAKQMSFVRSTSLIRPTPNFEVQANLGTSITRAASATSLLIQALKV